MKVITGFKDKYPAAAVSKEKALELDRFREMDYYAINHLNLSIELMMENAGLLLANFVAGYAGKKHQIKIGIGNGNNGGGGLVAARRLSAWGYDVYLDFFTDITKELPAMQVDRALKFGAKKDNISNPDVWIDAYLGFSQKLPLKTPLLNIIEQANKSDAMKVSLDIPTGFLGDPNTPYFKADKILTLAAPKEILYQLGSPTEIFIADLGIPDFVSTAFGTDPLPFHKNDILKLKR